MITNLIKVRNELDKVKKEIFKKLESIITEVWYETESWEVITSWFALEDEYTKNEMAIKEYVKANPELDPPEIKYYVIKRKISQEYDVDKLRMAIPWTAENYISVKEVVDKASLDKAIKKEEVSIEAKTALVTKSTSVSFVDKEKIAEREIKTFDLD